MSAPLTASQLQLGEYTIGQLRSALQGLPSEDLCRFLKVMGCHTLRLALVPFSSSSFSPFGWFWVTD